MDRHDVNWKGYWPAVPTPLTRDGALDERAWRELLRMYLAQGMHGVLVNGTTGEWFSQSDAERKRLAEIATEEQVQGHGHGQGQRQQQGGRPHRPNSGRPGSRRGGKKG